MGPASPDLTLVGVLEDGDGRPVGGAAVSLESGVPERAGDEARTGSDGAFRLRLPPGAGPAVTLAVTDRGRRFRLPVPTDDPERVRAVIVPADGVPLRVLTPGSAPVPRRFGWQALRRTSTGLVEGPSGDAGSPRFAVRGLAPGSYALVVWAGPFLPVVHEPVILDGTTSLPLLTVEVTRRGASMAGRVVDLRGEVRANASVRVKAEDASLRLPERRVTCVADAGGRWRLEGLPPGRYVLVAQTAEDVPSETTVNLLEREERAVDLVVGAGARA